MEPPGKCEATYITLNTLGTAAVGVNSALLSRICGFQPPEQFRVEHGSFSGMVHPTQTAQRLSYDGSPGRSLQALTRTQASGQVRAPHGRGICLENLD